MKSSSIYSSFVDQRQRPLSYYYDGERVLEEDHASPVGYKVPTIPDFEFDPSLVTNAGISCCTLNCELSFGLFIAVAIGGFLLFLSLSKWDDALYSILDGSTIHEVMGNISTSDIFH
jgi:hypothetical protein